MSGRHGGDSPKQQPDLKWPLFTGVPSQQESQACLARKTNPPEGKRRKNKPLTTYLADVT